MAKKHSELHEMFKYVYPVRSLLDVCGYWHLILDNITRLFESGVMLGDLDDCTTRFWPESETLLGIKKWWIEGEYLNVSIIFEDANGELFGLDDNPVVYSCPFMFLYLPTEDLNKLAAKYKSDCEDHSEKVEERALYERLKAKYENPQNEKHTCANCDFLKKKLNKKYYRCWYGGDDHELSWVDCPSWEPKGTNSLLLKHLKGEL